MGGLPYSALFDLAYENRLDKETVLFLLEKVANNPRYAQLKNDMEPLASALLKFRSELAESENQSMYMDNRFFDFQEKKPSDWKNII